MPEKLPTGTVTFVFTDIEGSTRLVSALGSAFGPLLERHQALLRDAFETFGGVEVSTEGDAFFVVFASALAAVAAAGAAQRALVAEAWPSEAATVRVRMGLHSGEGILGGDNYVGLDVHRAARIAAAAHGGQVLLSASTEALVAGSLPEDLGFRDLGEYRLKDLDHPERLAQLIVRGLREDFPPPRSLEVPSNLPSQVTSFVGRDEEIEAVGELLRRSRLVTLTGPGGTGKTRLSLRVAEQERPAYPGGTFFVELASISDPGLIPTTIAQSIGLREEASRPVVESLEAHLRDLRLLLVLDNFEQLISGAPLVGRLIDVAPHLTILATSREILHLRGEHEYPVPPLGAPDPGVQPSLESVTRYDAVLLFVQRAQAVRPDFRLDDANAQAVALICARLDGLPLAIELAAARTKLFAPAAILARLDKSLALLTGGALDLPERQRTLRGAIQWSFNLLEPIERTLFRRLAVFVGGCSIDSAQAVCDPTTELGIDVLDALGSFVDKSLMRVAQSEGGEPRFGMLETIREYALERLAESGDAPLVRGRHEEHFAAIAERAEAELLGGNPKAWLDRLDAERDNLRAALEWAADDGQIELALRMGAALWRFWQQRGHLEEGKESLVGLLNRSGASGRTSARAKALAALGGVVYWQGDFVRAGEAYAEALEIERMLGAPAGIAEALYNSGFVAALTGAYAEGRANYEEAIGIYEALADQPALTRLREALVFLMFHQGTFTEARTIQEQNVEAFREAREPYRLANALTLLSAIRLKERAFGQAHDGLGEAIRIFRGTRDAQAIVRILIIAAALAVEEGDPVRAARTSGAADVLKEPLGDIATPLQLLGLTDPAVAARRALGDEAFEAAYEAGRAMGLDEMVHSF